ncbi:MAG: oligosaccharide flippase family protein [Clostridia bacterium]|nr:oligosaccharide flippase family protein [Clostridia bacterium]
MKNFLMSLKRILIKSDAKHIVMLSAGVLFGQIISIILQPLATRLYSPEAFGYLSLVVSLGTMFSPISTLQYHISIVHSQKEDEYALCKLVFLCVLGTSLLLIGVILILFLLGDEQYSSVGLWIFVAVLLHFMTGITYLVDSYNNRHGEYALMTKVTVRRAIASSITKIGLGLFRFNFSGLLISQCIGTIAGIRKQSVSMVKHIKEIIAVNKNDVWRVARKYSDQPLFALPGVFILQFSYSALPLIINTAFSTREGGFFSLTVSILGLPLTLISNNVARVFFKNASEELEKTGSFKSSFRSTAILLTAISLVGFSLLWIIAEPVFSLVYGEEWIRSGTFTKILIPMYAARFVVSGLMHGFVISKRQKLKTFLQSLFIVAMAVGYIISKLELVSVEGFLIFINWMYFILYVVLFLVLWFQSKKSCTTTRNKKQEYN